MKKNDCKEKRFKLYDPIVSFFEWIFSCYMSDGKCISLCLEILKKYDN